MNIESSEAVIKSAAAKYIKVSENEIASFVILKRSIDARKKPQLFYIYSVALSVKDEDRIIKRFAKDNNVSLYKKPELVMPQVQRRDIRPLVVGFGPAGIFAGLILAKAGLNPVIIERGKAMEERTADVETFWKSGILDVKSNVSFGEGGAGAFSDGKLNTLVKDKDGYGAYVLDTFIKHGADENIRYDAKPHVGTDVLARVIPSIRKEIESLGGKVLFNTKLTELVIRNEKVCGAVLESGEIIECTDMILATGHSARDTFYALHEQGLFMQAKEFAVGFRCEHPQDMIGLSQYGEGYKKLPAAAYKLTANLDNGRGVYSFCMCPGGYVVNASSEENRLAINGMSYHARDSKNANSAIIVAVGKKEYDLDRPLAAIEYQRQLEEKAFGLCGGLIPQQLLGDYEKKRDSSAYGDFDSVTRGGTGFGRLDTIFSEEIYESVCKAFYEYGKKIKGFDRKDTILSGVESRTSSPVRINRDERFMANLAGLYPCGEGAGFAGGIMSAAMDGIKVALSVLKGN